MTRKQGNTDDTDEKNGDDELRAKSRFALQQIGRRIYELRAEKGMTQDRLSEESGVAQAYISEIENGLGNPSWDRISAICHTFKITFPQLVLDALFRNVSVDPETITTAAFVSRLLQEVLEDQAKTLGSLSKTERREVRHLRHK